MTANTHTKIHALTHITGYHCAVLEQLGVSLWLKKDTPVQANEICIDRMAVQVEETAQTEQIAQTGQVAQPLIQTAIDSKTQSTSQNFSQTQTQNLDERVGENTKQTLTDTPVHTSSHISNHALPSSAKEAQTLVQPLAQTPNQAPSQTPIQPTSQTAYPNTNTNTATNQNPVQNIHNPSAQGLCMPTDLPMGGQVMVKAQQFSMVGASFRHFVLLADTAFMDTVTHSVWQALITALAKQGAVLDLAVRYPLFDNAYADYQNFHHGQMALRGFLVRLCTAACTQASEAAPQCLLLTPMSEGIHIQLPLSHAPSLVEMAMHKEAKRDLWRTLMA